MKVLIVAHAVDTHIGFAAEEPEGVQYRYARAIDEARAYVSVALKNQQPFDVLVVEESAWKSAIDPTGGNALHTEALLKELQERRALPGHVIVLVGDKRAEVPPISVAGASLERRTLLSAVSWMARRA